MSGKQNADPISATTYAGFAASAPSEAPASEPELRLSGEARTYAREELRRRTARRRRAPVAAAVGLAIIVVIAAVGFALLYEPKMELTAPSSTPIDQPLPASADAALPSAPTAMPPPSAEAPPPAAPPVAAPRPPARPIARAAPAAKTPTAAQARSAAQAAADRAATDKVSALAALDQEVNKAYAEALRAGAPAGLAQAQENWVIRRERLQREDPDMAEDLARARIAELQALAAKKPEPSTDSQQTSP